jgi:hypothetical protein
MEQKPDYMVRVGLCALGLAILTGLFIAAHRAGWGEVFLFTAGMFLGLLMALYAVFMIVGLK